MDRRRLLFASLNGLGLGIFVSIAATVATPLPGISDTMAPSGWLSTTSSPAAGVWQIDFQPGDWPGAGWHPSPGHSWNWGERPTLIVTLENPDAQGLRVGLRIDDDPRADGSASHSRTASVDLEGHERRTIAVEVDPVHWLKEFGMRGGPVPETKVPIVPAWGTVRPQQITAFFFFVDHPTRAKRLLVSGLELLAAGDLNTSVHGLVDRWGQNAKESWPGKLASADQFASRRKVEAQDLADHPAPRSVDEWGGWQSDPRAQATGYFHTVQIDGRWWLVTPAGNLFFSSGIDVVRPGNPTITGPRANFFADLPPSGSPLAQYYGKTDSTLYGPYRSGTTFDFFRANWAQKWPDRDTSEWQSQALARLKSWGFNTLGNWSDESIGTKFRYPYTAAINVYRDFARITTGEDYWGKLPDPFDPKFALACREAFGRWAPRKDDPACLGVFVDNELSWAPELGRAVMLSSSSQPAKKALIAFLKSKYGNAEVLSKTWDVTPRTWNAWTSPVALPDPLPDEARADLDQFSYLLALEYFTVVQREFRTVDSNHLYLGCRFSGLPPPYAARAAAQVCDVLSYNVYRTDVRGDDWAFAESLGKPLIVGEFHFGALDRGLLHPGLVPVINQNARAEAFAHYLQTVADRPSWIGAHWFQYYDEPVAGRPLDGENYQIGFVSVTDDPYPEMVATARAVLPTLAPRHALAH